MPSHFKVDLDEINSVMTKLQGVQKDAFQDNNSALSMTTFHDNTASDIQQTAVSGQLKRVEEMDGGSSSTSFGSTEAIDAVGLINTAHGQLQQAIFGQVGTVNDQVEGLHTRLQQTHQAYSGTDGDLHGTITEVHRQAAGG